MMTASMEIEVNKNFSFFGTNSMRETNFYVYVYLDTLYKPGKYIYLNGKYKLEYPIFYVGKGTNRRLYSHLQENSLKQNSHKSNKIKKIIKETNENPIVIKLEENLSEEDAFNLEEILIKFIGIKNLTNKVEGKYGSLSGKDHPRFGKKHSEESIQKMKESHLGENNWNYGKKLKKSTRLKIAKKHIGISRTEETKKKISITRKKLNISKGEKNPRSKLKENDIIYIRKCYKENSTLETIKQLAKQFNIKSGSVSNIIKKRSWKHI